MGRARPRRGVRRKTFFTWAGTVRCRPAAWHHPADEDELIALVRRLSRAGERFKVVGAGHSWTPIACTDGHLIRLDRLDRVIAVDPEAGRVTVEAGIRLWDLARALRRRGLALENLGSVADQSLAGAIATGTHGTGLGFPSLSGQVLGLRLVTARGEALEIDGDSEPELFQAARLHLGALGVVTRVTLRCEPDFDLHERAFVLPFDAAVEQMLHLARGHQHLKMWWLPHTERVLVVCFDRTGARRRGEARLGRALERGVLSPLLFAPLLRLGHAAPAVVPAMNRALAQSYFRPRERVDWGPRVFTLPMPPRHDESEYALSAEQGPKALVWLRQHIEQQRLRVGFIVELRFSAAEQALLSPAFGRATCHLGAFLFHGLRRPAYFSAFEAEMQRRGGRPHWAKAHHFDATYLRGALPGYGAFAALRRRLDPRRRLDNAFLRRVFPD